MGSWFPRMTRRSTPSSEMEASLMTPPLEPSLSMARDSAAAETETLLEDYNSQHALQQQVVVVVVVYLRQ